MRLYIRGSNFVKFQLFYIVETYVSELKFESNKYDEKDCFQRKNIHKNGIFELLSYERNKHLILMGRDTVKNNLACQHVRLRNPHNSVASARFR